MNPPHRTWARVAVGLVLASVPPGIAGAQTDPLALAGREGLRDVEAYWSWLTTDAGYRVRTILTRPAGATRRLPAILFIQWLSCDSVTLPAQGGGGWTQMLRRLIEASNMVFVRTEKPGIGASERPSCELLDYGTELAVHRAALRALRERAEVDPDSIFLFGASMGGTMAPLLAQAQPVAGVMLWGTTGYSWLEHMILLDRRVLELRNVPVDSIAHLMPKHVKLHTSYLVDGLTPPAIIARDSSAGALWRTMLGTGPGHHYGRPFSFHQQAQGAAWEGAWSRVRAPVLVVRGEYDWLMSAAEHERIVEVVRRHSDVRLVTYPRMDHHFEVYGSLGDAFRGQGGRHDPGVVDVFLRWLAERRR